MLKKKIISYILISSLAVIGMINNIEVSANAMRLTELDELIVLTEKDKIAEELKDAYDKIDDLTKRLNKEKEITDILMNDVNELKLQLINLQMDKAILEEQLNKANEEIFEYSKEIEKYKNERNDRMDSNNSEEIIK